MLWETDPSIPPVLDLKLRYYKLMIRFYSHSNEYLEICRCYQNIMECEAGAYTRPHLGST